MDIQYTQIIFYILNLYMLVLRLIQPKIMRVFFFFEGKISFTTPSLRTTMTCLWMVKRIVDQYQWLNKYFTRSRVFWFSKWTFQTWNKNSYLLLEVDARDWKLCPIFWINSFWWSTFEEIPTQMQHKGIRIINFKHSWNVELKVKKMGDSFFSPCRNSYSS